MASNLRSQIIKLAYGNPSLRGILLPLVRKGTQRHLAEVSGKEKNLSVYDFDDTLVSSEGSVTVHRPDGSSHKLNSATFAHYSPQEGDELDFGAFNDVINPRVIKSNFERLKQNLKEGNKVVILTARPEGSASSVQQFLEDQGVKGVEVVALQSSDPYDKARWIDKEVSKGGYKGVSFYDDSSRNAEAVREHGEKHKAKGLSFESVNTPHPKEKDYSGPVVTKHFKSKNPTVAVSKVPTTTQEKKPGGGSSPSATPGGESWWPSQTKEFQEKYCGEHPASKYCGAHKEASMNSDRLVTQLKDRASKASPKVKSYILKGLIPKLEQAGPAAGIWYETLEKGFDTLKPEGLLKGFSPKDLSELKGLLFKL